MKSLHVILFFVITTVTLCAQNDKKFYRHEFQFTTGINSQVAFEVEPSYSFLFNKYIGLTLGLTLMEQSYNALGRILDLWLSDIYYYSDDDYSDDSETALLLRPAVRLSFPFLKDEEGDLLLLTIEPGAFFSLTPRVRDYANRPNHKHTYENLFFHLKTSVTANLERVQLSIGCGFSNFDMVEAARNKMNTFSLLVSVSHRF